MIPPEWWADQEEDSILIGDRDDVGSIEISTLHRDQGAFSDTEIQALARDNSDADWCWESAALGAFKGIGTRYQHDNDAVREWYVAVGGLLLFVTYSCDAENAGLDDAAVDELLDTLTPLPSPAAPR